jgi:hypothetical protein
MDLTTLIVAVYCVLDDAYQLCFPTRVRAHGPHAYLADPEVLTMEVIGSWLGLEQDKALFDYFRRHWTSLFPALRHLPRTTFVRQAAN